MASEKLTVAEALARAQLIDQTLDAWELTAPQFVQSVGERDGLARLSEMTCIGPVPRLDVASWQRACIEYVERWEREPPSRHAAARSTPAVLPGEGVAEATRKQSLWGIFRR